MHRRDFLKTAAASTALAFGPSLSSALGAPNWERSSAADTAVDRALRWLAENQGPAGSWRCKDLGLVSLGALAFLSAGHFPGRSKYGDNVARALDFVLSFARPSGLLNIAQPQRDMYNHGLSVFVLTQAFGVYNDRRLPDALDKGLKLICNVQCHDGGWKYEAIRDRQGHDLSLTVMQAKALRAGMDMGLEIPPDVVRRAVTYIRRCYRTYGMPDGKNYGSDPLAAYPGTFTYNGWTPREEDKNVGMSACGAVCLQEFGEYDDFRILRSLDHAIDSFRRFTRPAAKQMPIEAYAMFYFCQGLYQVGDPRWRDIYPSVRDMIIQTQDTDGTWKSGRISNNLHSKLFGTAVGVFALSIVNRYLPILQRGRHGGRSVGAR